MDIVVIVLILGALAVLMFKKINRVVYYLAMVDIFLRILSFISINIPITNTFLEKYFPSSISNIITTYSSGILETVLLWLIVLNYIVFEYYIIRIFLKKK